MITVAEALKIIKGEVAPLKSERVTIDDALGRVLAENIEADTDMPPFDRSQMDGYAVRTRDTRAAPVKLAIVGESAAGSAWKGELKRGEAVRIMTGAPLPAGADSVQKVEHTSEHDGVVTIDDATEKGRYIVRRGTEVKVGATVLSAGEIISARSIAVPAAFGYARVRVARRPRVAIMATGAEIVDIARRPKPDQIRNSNSVMLASLCDEAGAIAEILPAAGDDLSELKDRIATAVRTCDILVTTGGVSVGKYDLTKTALSELGAQIFFEKLRLRPGKPTVFAKLKKTHIFGLPGNPVSAAVTFYLFVRYAVRLMMSASETGLLQSTAILARDVKGTRERDSYLPVRMQTDAKGTMIAEPLRWHGSSDFAGFAGSDGLAIIPRSEVISKGAMVRVLHLPNA